MNMAELLDQYGSTIRLRKGQILTGTVVGKNDAGWLVDVGFMCEGVLPEREYTCNAIIETQPEPKPGDTINVEVVQIRDGEEAQLSLSRWRLEYSKRWDELEAKIQREGSIMDVRAISRVKGGLTVEACGLEGFIPLSLLTLAGRGADPYNFIGQTLKVKVLEHDKRNHRLVFSRRAVLEDLLNTETAPETVSPDKIIGAHEILQTLSREHYHNIILCPKGFEDCQDAQGFDADFVSDAQDAARLSYSSKIALIVLSRRNLAQVVDILADKTNELRIFCRTDIVDIAYGMN